MKICLRSASSEVFQGQIFKHQLLVAPTRWAHAKYKYVHVRFSYRRAMPIHAEMWHFENRCCKILAHILWEQQWHLSCWKHSFHFYFSLLGRLFILFPLVLEVFLMLLSVWKICPPSACQSHFLFKSLLQTSPNQFLCWSYCCFLTKSEVWIAPYSEF